MNCIICGKDLEGNQIKFCSNHCKNLYKKRKQRGLAVNVRPRRSHLEWTDKDIQDRINTKSSKILYIGGYKDSESYMYLYCTDCGQPFKWSARGLRKQKPIQCNNCRSILTNIKDKETQAEKEERQAIIEAKREKRKCEAEEHRHRICAYCGTHFVIDKRRNFCSDICARKYNNKTRDNIRRNKIKESKVNSGITIERLIKRDGCKCWLCGKPVNKNDYEVRSSGTFIAGASYPSIDHVVALANGGSHSWDNVRITHMRCNTIKRDKLIAEEDNGQLKLFC